MGPVLGEGLVVHPVPVVVIEMADDLCALLRGGGEGKGRARPRIEKSLKAAALGRRPAPHQTAPKGLTRGDPPRVPPTADSLSLPKGKALAAMDSRLN